MEVTNANPAAVPAAHALASQQQGHHAEVPPPLGVTRAVTGAASVVVILSALVAAGVAQFRGAQPYSILLGMESCIIVAGVIGLLFWRGRFREGPGMTLTCIAGTLLVAAILGWTSVHQRSLSGGIALRGGGTFSLNAWLFGRLGVALLLGMLGAFEVLRRDRRSVAYLMRAALAGLPLVVMLGAGWKLRGWVSTQTMLPAWLTWTLMVVGAIVAMILACISAHCLIRAFEMGRPGAAAEESEDLPATRPSGR